MNKMQQLSFIVLLILAVMLVSCSPNSTSVPVAPPEDAIQAVDTLQPTNTVQPTSTVQPTAFPGKVVFPLDSLQFGIPWLPLDKSEIPMVVYYGFNVNVPPFNIPEVRQAFAAALDTEVLTLIYSESPFYNNEVSTRTIIPRETLTRDVSGEIGLAYDPALAKQLLVDAGYADLSTFPEIKLLIIYPVMADYPGIMINAAKESIRMWQENLGVKVEMEVESIESPGIQEQRDLILTGKYQIFEHGVWVNLNDPHEFVSGLFSPNGYNNLTGYNYARVTKLINDGASEADPAKRMPIYLELERMLSEQELPIIPLFHCTVDGSQW